MSSEYEPYAEHFYYKAFWYCKSNNNTLFHTCFSTFLEWDQEYSDLEYSVRKKPTWMSPYQCPRSSDISCNYCEPECIVKYAGYRSYSKDGEILESKIILDRSSRRHKDYYLEESLEESTLIITEQPCFIKPGKR
jgi:hypothetical protein